MADDQRTNGSGRGGGNGAESEVERRGQSSDGKPVFISKTRMGLKRGVKSALRAFAWVAVPIVVWVLLLRLDLLSEILTGRGNLIISVILFLLSIPVSIFIRLDKLLIDYGLGLDDEYKLLAMLPIVLANFLLVGAYRGWRHSLLTPEQIEARRSRGLLGRLRRTGKSSSGKSSKGKQRPSGRS